MNRLALVPILVGSSMFVACGGSDAPSTGATDSGAADSSSTDSSSTDSSSTDSGKADSTSSDSLADSSSTDSGGGDSATDSGAIDSGAIDSGVDSGVCNALVNVGAVIDETNVAAPMPTFSGGTISPGTYKLIKDERYTGTGGASGPTGGTLKETLLVSGTTIDSVLSDKGSSEKTSSTTYTVSGSKATVTGTCGSPGTFDFGFDATSTTLKLGISIAGLNAVLTFSK